MVRTTRKLSLKCTESELQVFVKKPPIMLLHLEYCLCLRSLHIKKDMMELYIVKNRPNKMIGAPPL